MATGANSFFIMERSKAEQYNIPNFALKPILPKAKFLTSKIIESNIEGLPNVSPQLVLIDCDLNEEVLQKKYPVFYDYLETAKIKQKDEKSIIERTLIASRNPWYKQENREPAPFLLTTMSRNELFFLLNKSKATALNTYILLYPKKWLMDLLQKNNSMYEKILISLNETAKNIIKSNTRIYSGGLQKIEPGDLKKLLIIDLPEEVVAEYCRLKTSCPLSETI